MYYPKTKFDSQSLPRLTHKVHRIAIRWQNRCGVYLKTLLQHNLHETRSFFLKQRLCCLRSDISWREARATCIWKTATNEANGENPASFQLNPAQQLCKLVSIFWYYLMLIAFIIGMPLALPLSFFVFQVHGYLHHQPDTDLDLP